MPESPDNPFTNRGMITTEAEFAGRTREISKILNHLKNCNSVSVVGDRRIGKSSLLYHLFLTGNKRLKDKTKTAYKFIYIDALDALFSTPADFTMEVLKALNINPDEEKLQEFPLKVLSGELRKYKEEGILPVLLVDEFEKLSEKKEIFADTFFESLRSCCNNKRMAIVTSSQHSL